MFGIFPSRGSWPIGIDLGSDSIKVMQLRKSGGVLSVVDCARERLPHNASCDPGELHSQRARILEDLLRKGNFRGRRVVMALSCGDLHLKMLRLPQMPESEIPQAVRWEAAEQFDFEPRRDQLCFINAGQVRVGEELRNEIIMMAAGDEAVNSRVRLADELGLRLENIDAEPLALFRCFERLLKRREDAEAVTVLVDLGRVGTRVVVARGRDVVFVKNIDIGGRDLVGTVAEQLNLSETEADELRLKIMREQAEGGGKDSPLAGNDSVQWTVFDSVRSKVEELAHEIMLCLRYCAVTFRGLRPKEVLLTGGEAYDPALASLLDEHLNCKSTPGRPLRFVDLSRVSLGADRRGVLCEWGVCAGLALRNAGRQSQSEEQDAKRRLSA
ncbi:MAG: pilus assembly protein PilM [Phycisphaerae bacterium]